MDLHEVEKAILMSGGSQYQCGWKGARSRSPSHPPGSQICMTLRNGMTIHVNGDPATFHIEICNSKTLHGCKGELWYRVDSIESDNSRVQLKGSAVRLLVKGMPTSQMKGLIQELGLFELELGLQAPVPTPSRRLVYQLPDMARLLIELAEDGASVKRLVIDAIAKEVFDRPRRRVRFECQAVDPLKPLKEMWYFAFQPEQEWKPD